jgi:hypothetical protein
MLDIKQKQKLKVCERKCYEKEGKLPEKKRYNRREKMWLFTLAVGMLCTQV